jgi:hypothetical protein
MRTVARHFNDKPLAKDRQASTQFRLTRKDAAYFAGLLDGEGCITINKPSYQLAVRIVMKEAGAIEFLASKTGWLGGKVYQDKNSFGLLFRWQVTSNRACVFLEEIHPFLHVKQQQADWAMTFQALKGTLGRLNNEQNETFYWKLRNLNAKQKRANESRV